MPERAVFDYGRLEIIRKWGKMDKLDIDLKPIDKGLCPVDICISYYCITNGVDQPPQRILKRQVSFNCPVRWCGRLQPLVIPHVAFNSTLLV
jgi:hypothetical protein